MGIPTLNKSPSRAHLSLFFFVAGYSFFDSGDIDRLGREQKRAANFVGE